MDIQITLKTQRVIKRLQMITITSDENMRNTFVARHPREKNRIRL